MPHIAATEDGEKHRREMSRTWIQEKSASCIGPPALTLHDPKGSRCTV